MRKVILMLLLAVVSGSAMAEWREFYGDESSTYYYESASILRQGNKAKILQMLDFKDARTLEGITFSSVQREYEFDCKAEKARMLSFVFYSKNMAAGKVVGGSDKWSNWKPVNRGDGMMSIACEHPPVAQGRFN